MKKYIIKMAGIGESYLLLVDKDVWDWATDYTGKNPCPSRVADSMWSQLNDEHDSKKEMIEDYAGRAPDERAAYLMETEKYFGTISELMKFVKKNNITIAGEEELAIY